MYIKKFNDEKRGEFDMKENDKAIDKKKRNKEKKIREKKLNDSLKTLPKRTQQSFGLYAVQEETGVFCFCEGKFIKVYSILNADESGAEKCASFINLLCSSTFRMRLSSFADYRIGVAKRTIRFLTIFIKAESYGGAHDEFKKMDSLIKKTAEKTEVTVVPCTIEQVLTVVNMNFTGKVENIGLESVIRQNEDLKKIIIPELEESHNNFRKMSDSYGISYNAMLFSEEFQGISDYMKDKPYCCCMCIDFQVMGEKEKELFEHELVRKYNHVRKLAEKRNTVNMTFLLSVLTDSVQDREKMEEKFLEDRNILLVPCTGTQIVSYSSICSLGLMDYHESRNFDRNLLGKLFL